MSDDGTTITDPAPVVPAPYRPSLPRKIFGALLLGMILTLLVSVAIWPGELKLLAPLFCTDAQPDSFVVTDSYQVRPGETSYNFSLYCMGPRGDVTNVGVWKPYSVLFVIHTLIGFGIVTWLQASGNAARRALAEQHGTAGGTGGKPSGSTAGPFVD